MNYCSNCGSSVSLKIPPDDHRERYVCESCSAIHYQNPNVVVGTIPIRVGDDGRLRVLLCRRAIEPRHGYWTLPAGFLENGETAADGARRETVEESCASIDNLVIYRMFNVVHASQIHMFFRSDMLSDSFSTTTESSDVQLFLFDDIPWGELAFPTVHKTLRDYLADLRSGLFEPIMEDIDHSYWHRMSDDS